MIFGVRFSKTKKITLFQSTILTLLVLLLCNIAFIGATGWERLGWSLIGYLGLGLIYHFSGLKRDEIGLSFNRIKSGIKLAIIWCVIIGTSLLLLLLFDENLFKDERYRQSLFSAFFAIMIYLPLKTVIFEELAFRGILPALLLKIKNKKFATLGSSLAFGFWHVSTSLSFNFNSDQQPPQFLILLAVVIFTSSAGFILMQLRWRSDSLVAPLVVHWFANASAIVSAAVLWN